MGRLHVGVVQIWAHVHGHQVGQGDLVRLLECLLGFHRKCIKSLPLCIRLHGVSLYRHIVDAIHGTGHSDGPKPGKQIEHSLGFVGDGENHALGHGVRRLARVERTTADMRKLVGYLAHFDDRRGETVQSGSFEELGGHVEKHSDLQIQMHGPSWRKIVQVVFGFKRLIMECEIGRT